MSLIQWSASLLIGLYPVLSIVLHNAGNACLFLLLMVALCALATRQQPESFAFNTYVKAYWPLLLAMASLLLSVLLNQMASGHFVIKFYDRGLRLALFILTFWAVLFVPLRLLRWLPWSFALGVVLALAKAYWLSHGGDDRPSNIGFLSTIAYSNLAFLMGCLVLTSITCQARGQPWLSLFKMLIAFMGVYVTVMVKTRGSWLAIPFFLVFFLLASGMRSRAKWLITFLSILSLSAIFFLSDSIQSRLNESRSDVAQYYQGQKDTSIGIRLQLWEASWRLFKTAPLFGIGRENYPQAVATLAEQQIITPVAAAYAHSHNELLFNMAISGIWGLLASLALYLVPGYYFGRELHHPNREVRGVARMGILVCLGFWVFGLTDLMFFWPVLTAFYSMSLAAFLAWIIQLKQTLLVVSKPI
ncbi:O-antigen ligase family protein [Ampullimonas aquatilis]|uniref:O-antigen ligase family protein n=1 Tax=Ampullimonas aquatilis TaxID=1341549 RepID=UPI003C7369D6